MGRSKSQAKSSVKQPEEPSPTEPISVGNLYEGGALKQTLDEVAREAVLDAGYEEDIRISNIKILLGLAAIGCALYAQFGPGKFPANWWAVFGCVVAYLVLTIAMNIYSWRMEADAFLVTRPFRGSKGLRVASRMDRFSDAYSLVITDRADPQLEVTSAIRIPDYFHEDGYLAVEAWRREVEKLCTEYSIKHGAKGAKKSN
ncbi:hypothetical protein Agub_g5059 [Astrephomene gubernaculifera]|uniref:Signal peptidase complex subunit 2 n=1 Tax=Astrephomene gubernaculifera TaxID=47775 RepID=A0AAD3HKE4_9CHLO|nr:hypothetical protein Agub_g5059 [Astrephomene gubernaculifera]